MQAPTQAEIDEDGWEAWAEGEKRAFEAYEAARVESEAAARAAEAAKQKEHA